MLTILSMTFISYNYYIDEKNVPKKAEPRLVHHFARALDAIFGLGLILLGLLSPASWGITTEIKYALLASGVTCSAINFLLFVEYIKYQTCRKAYLVKVKVFPYKS